MSTGLVVLYTRVGNFFFFSCDPSCVMHKVSSTRSVLWFISCWKFWYEEHRRVKGDWESWADRYTRWEPRPGGSGGKDERVVVHDGGAGRQRPTGWQIPGEDRWGWECKICGSGLTVRGSALWVEVSKIGGWRVNKSSKYSKRCNVRTEKEMNHMTVWLCLHERSEMLPSMLRKVRWNGS